MDIADPVKNIVDSVDWKLMVPIVECMFAFYIMLWAKNYIISLHAWLSFKSSLNICLGTWVRIDSYTGFVDGQIKFANRTVIVVETKDLSIFIPTKTFRERDWVLLKKAAMMDEDGDVEKK